MATCQFFYDFSSPYSYLAATQIERVCRGHILVWRPFLLGALFKAIGTPVVPIAAFPEAKAKLAMADQLRWAEHWGVELNVPGKFPQRTVLALRAALQVPPELIGPVSLDLFRTMWVEGGDLEDPATVGRVLSARGLDGAAILAGTERPEIKEALRHTTDQAVSLGICGAPTCVVGDLLFWGQDRLHFVEAALAGWVPRAERRLT